MSLESSDEAPLPILILSGGSRKLLFFQIGAGKFFRAVRRIDQRKLFLKHAVIIELKFAEVPQITMGP